MALALISFYYFFFYQHEIYQISSRVLLHCIMFYYINELYEDGLNSFTRTLRKKRNIIDYSKIEI